MTALSLSTAFLLSLFQLDSASALSLPFQGTSVHPSRALSLARRADPSTPKIPISNTHNAQYIANVTLGGQPTPVLLDTGSSDLWVNFRSTIPPNKDLGKKITLNYAIGQAKGNVHTTELKFDDYVIPDQAFLLVEDTSTFSSDIHLQGYDGLLGLGPNSGSVVRDKVDSTAGDTMLERIFSQDKETDNYITFLLDRLGDPTPSFTGQFTVSELVPGFENITSMPKLKIDEVLLDSDQHWQIFTDKDIGIRGPDGNYVAAKSIVPSAPKRQLVAVIDSGFTFSQVPRDVSDAIYGRVQGAVYDEANEYWTVPCGQELNIAFSFGGHEYPIHPLDTVNDNFNIVDKAGNKVCIGTFQPITSAFSLLGHYDMILGMSFLRNTYTLLDFGDWVEGSKVKRADPFARMLSVTDKDQAHKDFVQARLGGVDTTSDAKWQLLPSEQMQHSPISDEEKKKKYQEMVLSRWPYIFAGCLVFVLFIIGFVTWKCCKRRRERRAQAKVLGGHKAEVYVQLEPPSKAYIPNNLESGYKRSFDSRR